jgi:O-antigen/teichoic acid export membrane protein
MNHEILMRAIEIVTLSALSVLIIFAIIDFLIICFLDGNKRPKRKDVLFSDAFLLAFVLPKQKPFVITMHHYVNHWLLWGLLAIVATLLCLWLAKKRV